jgi:hypothetical protein
MATQWNYDFSPGEVLTAGVMDSLGAVWETWTPNFRSSAGAWTSSTTNFARYGRIGKIVLGQASISITSVGTATGLVTFDLPITAQSGGFIGFGFGREIALSGNTFLASANTTTVGSLRFFNNGETAAGLWTFPFTFMYEAA